MNSLRLLAAVIFLVGISLTGISAARAEIVEGTDYTLLPQPRPTDSDGKIEVIEFFWYGCPHCYELHPRIKAFPPSFAQTGFPALKPSMRWTR